MAPVSDALLRRPRGLTLALLIVLAALAWLWLLGGAGMNEAAMMAAQWDASRFALTMSMWWVMMAAMMLPAAAPVILLHDHAARRHGTAATGRFLAAYLVAWGGFSLAATLAQFMLERAGLVSAMTMAASNARLGCGLLVAAGLYQLSPWKGACLDHCRNPADFIARHHRSGPFKMGLIHGAWCVGCCWALMILLFVGGVMNLAWIAALALLVAAEKLLPFGRWIPIASAPLLIGGGALLVLGG